MTISTSPQAADVDERKMQAPERQATTSLAAVFALRMLGLFVVLPVFVLEATRYPGGDDPAWVGFALGAYGLAQAFLQMPLGMASDHFGRKRVIVLGLIVFALGSILAAVATSIQMLALGRALQGAGAISAAVTALLADLTRDAVRTKAMAVIGGSIGLVFAFSLMIAPPLAGWIGLSGLFWLTAVLALICIYMVLRATPQEPRQHAEQTRGRLADVWMHPKLWRMDLGIFVLHTVQMAMWVVVPSLLVQAGLPKAAQWKIYVPVVLGSFIFLGWMLSMERKGHLQGVMRASIALLAVAQVAFLVFAPQSPGLWVLGIVLFLFFAAFNMLEASLPSLISKLAPEQARGAALGMYNTMQSIGLFVGAAVGGWTLKYWGSAGVFGATTLLALLWLALGWAQPMPEQDRRGQ